PGACAEPEPRWNREVVGERRKASREGKNEGRRGPRPPWLDSGGNAEPPGARETHAARPISGSRFSLLWKLFVFASRPGVRGRSAPTPRIPHEDVFTFY